MKSKKMFLVTIIICLFSCFLVINPIDILAKEDQKIVVKDTVINSNDDIKVERLTEKNKTINTTSNNSNVACKSILGDKSDPNYEESLGWLIEKALNYLKILGPLIIIVLSSLDFAKAIISSNDDAIKKAQKKLITRLIAAVLLFFVPVIVQILLDIFGFTDSTCQI